MTNNSCNIHNNMNMKVFFSHTCNISMKYLVELWWRESVKQHFKRLILFRFIFRVKRFLSQQPQKNIFHLLYSLVSGCKRKKMHETQRNINSPKIWRKNTIRLNQDFKWILNWRL